MEERKFPQIEDQKWDDRRGKMSVCNETELVESAMEVSGVKCQATEA
jgi:hypothetical protein